MTNIREYGSYFKNLSVKTNINIRKNRDAVTKIFFVLVIFMFILFFYFFRAPSDFPPEIMFRIEDGAPLDSIALKLRDESVIRSPFWFKVVSYLSFNQKSLVSGDYYFNRSADLFGVISRLSSGEYGLSAVRITFPEGVTIKEIGLILEANLPDFDKERFYELSSDKEGFLFPDTYYFPPNAGALEIIAEMSDNFEKKISSLSEETSASGKSIKEIITMASIIEEETRDGKDKRLVSGILWKRMEIGMPLQVDAVFIYYNGKNSYQLTADDLKEDHPYNTYTNLGLPPSPISNPGLESITAALLPEESEYLFYLSDNSGRIYYARDFSGHQRNRELYLRK